MAKRETIILSVQIGFKIREKKLLPNGNGRTKILGLTATLLSFPINSYKNHQSRGDITQLFLSIEFKVMQTEPNLQAFCLRIKF